MNPLRRYHYGRSFFRPKGFIRSGRPDRPLKYGFAQPSSPFIQNKLALDSVVAGSEPVAAEPESSPLITLLRVVISESPRSHAYSHRPLNTYHPESYSFRDLANIIVPSFQKTIAIPPGEIEGYLFIKIKNNDNPFPLLSSNRPGPFSIKKGKRILKRDPQNYFRPSASPFTAPTQKGHSPSNGDSNPEDLLPLARTEQGSSTRKDRANSESLDEAKKGPVNKRPCIGCIQSLISGQTKTSGDCYQDLSRPKSTRCWSCKSYQYLIATDVLVTVGKLYTKAFKAKDKKIYILNLLLPIDCNNNLCLEKHCKTLRDLLAEYDTKRAALKITSLIDLLLQGQGKSKGKSMVIFDSYDEEDKEDESFRQMEYLQCKAWEVQKIAEGKQKELDRILNSVKARKCTGSVGIQRFSVKKKR
ncbi:hypothetical protein BOTCAL_0879g00010 [Botryotinia calthae]|uniref:Uncharacterized protein n=1 Tax=Botryotinia calthae TaxID=38488 RepID=A0A4Y8CHV7_9HELO|nr:hypothetical protein BOTCAL_0879g00010 [Botryotinia calthae]